MENIVNRKYTNIASFIPKKTIIFKYFTLFVIQYSITGQAWHAINLC